MGYNVGPIETWYRSRMAIVRSIIKPGYQLFLTPILPEYVFSIEKVTILMGHAQFFTLLLSPHFFLSQSVLFYLHIVGVEYYCCTWSLSVTHTKLHFVEFGWTGNSEMSCCLREVIGVHSTTGTDILPSTHISVFPCQYHCTIGPRIFFIHLHWHYIGLILAICFWIQVISYHLQVCIFIYTHTHVLYRQTDEWI